LENPQALIHNALHMPRVATKLTPTKGGGFTARKRIPEDVQADYERLYGVRWEARLSIAQAHPFYMRAPSTASGFRKSRAALRTSEPRKEARGGI
jgi:hypothetical protein